MQIPNTNQVVAPAPLVNSPRVSAQDLGVGEVANALGNVARTTQAIGADMAGQQEMQRRHDEAEAKQKQLELDRSKALAAKVEFDDGTDNALTTLQTSIQTGQLKREDAPAKYQEVIKANRDAAMSKVPESMREHTSVLFDATALRGARRVGDITEAARRDEIKANLATITDSYGKQASLPGADVAAINAEYEKQARLLGKDAGIPDALLEKHIQDFKDTNNFGSFKTRLIDSGDNINALKKFSAEVRKSDVIDPDKKLSLLGAAESKIATLENRAAIHAEAAMRKAQASFTAFSGFLDAGRMPTPDYVQSTLSQVKGTPFEGAVRQMLEQAPHTSAFASAPLAQQERALQADLANLNQNGSNPAAEAAYRKREAIFTATQEAIKKDPLNAALERNVIPALPPLNMNDLASLPAQLAERQRVTGQVSAWTGKTVSPFTAVESEQIGQTIGKLPAEQKATALRTLATAIPPAQMMAVSKQLGEKDHQLGIAAVLATRDTTFGNNVGMLYLKGKEALKEGLFKMDEAKETGVKAQIYQTIGNAYATPEGKEAAAEAAYGVYAGLRANSGTDNVRQAVGIATGGILEHNGGKIVAPYGWTKDRFSDWMKSVKPENLGADKFYVNGHEASASTIAQALPGSRLLPYGDGAYLVQAGSDVVRLQDGMPYVLRVK